MDNKNEKKQTGIRLDAGCITALKHLSLDLKRSYTSLIQEAVDDLLKKYKIKPK
jgi:predicted DNA-binding protein